MAEKTAERDESRVDEDRAPDEPTGLKGKSFFATLKRSVTEFQEDNLTDWAAALTYYGVLSIFPALLALVSILGLLGTNTIDSLVSNIGSVAPGAAKSIVTDALTNLKKNQGAAGFAFVIGLALAIWSASGYVAAFMRASNDIYDVEEGRPIWKTLPTRVITTVVMLLMFAAVAVAVAVSGPLADKLGQLLGVGDTAVTVWDIAKWPIILIVVMTMFAVLYWASPNVKHPKFRWVSPGGVIGVLLWIIASAAFAFYVANFGSYNKTYGAMATPIIFLLWLWISNIAILFGAELNAELERSRQLEGGLAPEDKEPFLEPRDTRKMKD